MDVRIIFPVSLIFEKQLSLGAAVGDHQNSV